MTVGKEADHPRKEAIASQLSDEGGSETMMSNDELAEYRIDPKKESRMMRKFDVSEATSKITTLY